MRYWDASVIVPLLVDQAGTAAVTTEYEHDSDLMVWWATRVETGSALARLARDGALTEEARLEAERRARRLEASWNEIDPTDRVRQQAMRLLRVHPLRAADSLQLAAAIVAAEGEPATLPFVTLDARLAEAAAREGFPVVRPMVPADDADRSPDVEVTDQAPALASGDLAADREGSDRRGGATPVRSRKPPQNN